jgi:condensin complex subunit 3
VCEAVENQLLSDATGRNALYKIHVSLGKIVNNLDAAAEGAAGAGVGGKYRRSVSRASSVGAGSVATAATAGVGGGVAVEEEEDRTVVQHEVRIKEEEEEDDDAGTVIHRSTEQSLVSEVLSEEEL